MIARLGKVFLFLLIRRSALYITSGFALESSLDTTLRAWCARVVERHAGVFPDGVSLERSLFRRDTINVHGAVTALRGNVFIQGVPSNALHIVTVFGYLMNTFTCVHDELSPGSKEEWRGTEPSTAVKTRAQLSVLPARIYSPDGLHARSYTCIVVHLNPVERH